MHIDNCNPFVTSGQAFIFDLLTFISVLSTLVVDRDDISWHSRSIEIVSVDQVGQGVAGSMLARHTLLNFAMKITLIAAISADGKIAEKADQSSLDWTSKEDTQFFIETTKQAGTVVMGRKTFATINKPLKGRRLIILTSKPSQAAPMPGVEFTSEEPTELVRRLANEGVAQLALAGGSSVYGQFLKAGLVTDVYLTIEPILFGAGVPLAQGFGRIPLKLESIKQLNPQTVVLHYSL